MEKTADNREGLRRFFACVLLFFLVSFLGWCAEKLFFYFALEANVDRGFLKLPFCTIYGGSLLIVRAVCKTPLHTQLSYPKNLFSLLLYGVTAALVATAAELVTGLFFESVFHVRLWSYQGYAHEYRTYICLTMSVSWGFLITAAMAFFWSPLERVLVKAPVGTLGVAIGLLALALSLDFVLTAISCF